MSQLLASTLVLRRWLLATDPLTILLLLSLFESEYWLTLRFHIDLVDEGHSRVLGHADLAS